MLAKWTHAVYMGVHSVLLQLAAKGAGREVQEVQEP